MRMTLVMAMIGMDEGDYSMGIFAKHLGLAWRTQICPHLYMGDLGTVGLQLQLRLSLPISFNTTSFFSWRRMKHAVSPIDCSNSRRAGCHPSRPCLDEVTAPL